VDLVEQHRRSLDQWRQTVESVRPEDWDGPTPCTEWTVRDLVNHVVGEDRWTGPLMEGRTIADVGDALDGDLLGSDPKASAQAAADEAESVVAEKLPDEPVVHLSYGDEQGAEYVRQLIADHLIHSWDLAAAVGADRELDPGLVDAVSAWFAEREDLYRSAGMVADRPDAAVDSPQDRLLVAGGRDPRWSAT